MRVRPCLLVHLPKHLVLCPPELTQRVSNVCESLPRVTHCVGHETSDESMIWQEFSGSSKWKTTTVTGSIRLEGEVCHLCYPRYLELCHFHRDPQRERLGHSGVRVIDENRFDF